MVATSSGLAFKYARSDKACFRRNKNCITQKPDPNPNKAVAQKSRLCTQAKGGMLANQLQKLGNGLNNDSKICGAFATVSNQQKSVIAVSASEGGSIFVSRMAMGLPNAEVQHDFSEEPGNYHIH